MSEFRNEGCTFILRLESVVYARKLSKWLSWRSRACQEILTGLTETFSMRKLTGKKFFIVGRGCPSPDWAWDGLRISLVSSPNPARSPGLYGSPDSIFPTIGFDCYLGWGTGPLTDSIKNCLTVPSLGIKFRERVVEQAILANWNCRWTGNGKNLSTKTINPKSA